jgi:hypothetical protein
LCHADVITPPKPDLGTPNLEEDLQWGASHQVGDSPALRKGTAPDYGSLSVEFQGGAVGRQTEHPRLDDGWRVQLFVDAARQSAKRGEWVELGEVEGEV